MDEYNMLVVLAQNSCNPSQIPDNYDNTNISDTQNVINQMFNITSELCSPRILGTFKSIERQLSNA